VVHDTDPLNPPGPGDETASHVYPKSGMVLDQEALLDGAGRWGDEDEPHWKYGDEPDPWSGG